MVFFASPKLSLSIEQNTLYLHPNPSSLSLSLPADDQVIRGVITLSLPKPKAYNKIRVLLEGKTRIPAIGNHTSEEIEIVKSVLELPTGELPAGEHKFEFEFILPASSPEYQRSTYGHTRYFVSATCDGIGAFAGSLSTPLTTVFPIGNSAARGEIPGMFDALLTGYQEDLGPISLTLSSPYLTVSSLLFYDLVLSSPPPFLKLLSIRGFLSQRFLLIYSKGPHAPPESKLLLFAVTASDPSPSASSSSSSSTPTPESRNHKPHRDPKLPCTINLLSTPPLPSIGSISPHGEEWTYRKLCRLPHDDILRPTTLEDSSSRIRVSHTIGLEFKFLGKGENGEEKEMTYIMGKEVFITSCCALRDDPTLPSYAACALDSDSPHSSSPSTKSHGHKHADKIQPFAPRPRTATDAPFRQVQQEECTCTRTIDQLIEDGDKQLGGLVVELDEGGNEPGLDRVEVASGDERARKTPAASATIGTGRTMGATRGDV